MAHATADLLPFEEVFADFTEELFTEGCGPTLVSDAADIEEFVASHPELLAHHDEPTLEVPARDDEPSETLTYLLAATVGFTSVVVIGVASATAITSAAIALWLV